jgi:hypothetical protein
MYDLPEGAGLCFALASHVTKPRQTENTKSVHFLPQVCAWQYMLPNMFLFWVCYLLRM